MKNKCIRTVTKLTLYIFTLIIFIHTQVAWGDNSSFTLIPSYDPQVYFEEFGKVLQQNVTAPLSETTQRIEQASSHFLGKKYLIPANGEGWGARYDEAPLYRTDAFDCTTYVNTVLALAFAKDAADFVDKIKDINYREKDDISFFTRNHFISTDWNVHNQKKGYVTDITKSFNVPIRTAEVKIDKPSWFRHLGMQTLRFVQPISNQEAQLRLKELHQYAVNFQAKWSDLVYLPLTSLFSKQNGQLVPNKLVFDKIPSGAVIEIVREDLDLMQKIGTHLDVTHMGFAIRTPKGLMFREASSVKHVVTDVPLDEYLRKYYTPKYKIDLIGINIQKSG